MENLKSDLNYTLEYSEELLKILENYKCGDEVPLNKKEVDILVKHLKNQINLTEGNITLSEYNQLEGCNDII